VTGIYIAAENVVAVVKLDMTFNTEITAALLQ
jgi:hypothetical protein